MGQYSDRDGNAAGERDMWSIPLFSWGHRRVRAHVTLFLILTAILLYWLSVNGIVLALLFLLAVIWHESGHYVGALAVGARIDDVTLWPVGGMTRFRMTKPGVRESVIVHLSGPLANLALALFTLPAIHVISGLSWSILNPFVVEDSRLMENALAHYLCLAFKANYWLLLMNLLPLFPLDGGRVLTDVLARHIHAFQANVVASSVGICGGLLMTGVSLWWNNPWVAALGALVAYASFCRHRELEFLGDQTDNEFGYDFSEGYTSLERSMATGPPRPQRIGLGAVIREWIEERRVKDQEYLESELDRILAKIHSDGLKSLSRTERRTLGRASKKRKR